MFFAINFGVGKYIIFRVEFDIFYGIKDGGCKKKNNRLFSINILIGFYA